MSRNAARFDALRAQGYEGDLSTMTMAWLRDNGATSPQYNDAWHEFLQAQLQPVVPPGPNIYVNPTLAGGAASGPIDGSNPPDNHTIGFNTANSGPHAAGWEMNPEGDTGRCYLAYSLQGNNPGLSVGDIIRLSVDIEQVTGLGTNALSASAVSGLILGNNDSFVEAGERRIVTLEAEIDDETYTAQLRMGTGVTNNRTEHWIIYQPSRLEVVLPPPPVIEFPGTLNDLWFQLLGEWGYEGALNDRDYAFWLAGGLAP